MAIGRRIPTASGNRYRLADSYGRSARREGYLARSVHKLRAIDERFGIIREGAAVLDLGAAPGSWSQYCLRRLGEHGRLVAVDRLPAQLPSADRRLCSLTGDFSDPAIRRQIVERGGFDAALSDAAPNTSGIALIDSQRSLEIVRVAAAIALETLVPRGVFVAKIFQGNGEERDLASEIAPRFKIVRYWKPAACRPSSRETFLIATGYLG